MPLKRMERKSDSGKTERSTVFFVFCAVLSFLSQCRIFNNNNNNNKNNNKNKNKNNNLIYNFIRVCVCVWVSVYLSVCLCVCQFFARAHIDPNTSAS